MGQKTHVCSDEDVSEIEEQRQDIVRQNSFRQIAVKDVLLALIDVVDVPPIFSSDLNASFPVL